MSAIIFAYGFSETVPPLVIICVLDTKIFVSFPQETTYL